MCRGLFRNWLCKDEKSPVPVSKRFWALKQNILIGRYKGPYYEKNLVEASGFHRGNELCVVQKADTLDKLCYLPKIINDHVKYETNILSRKGRIGMKLYMEISPQYLQERSV